MEIRDFLKISKSGTLDFSLKCIFCQTKIFETWTLVKVYAPSISRSYEPCGVPWWPQTPFNLIFCHFLKSHIFDILTFSRKFTIGPNALEGTWESVSTLDLSIPRLVMTSTHAGKRTFFVKKRDFLDLEAKSPIWSYINQIELHQPNSILLM